MADDATSTAEVDELKARMADEGDALENSASKIQAIARGRKSRQRGDRRKVVQGTSAKTESEMAAAKLQSMQRGKNARKKVNDMKVSASDSTDRQGHKTMADAEVYFFGIDGRRVGERPLALSSASGIGGTGSLSRF